MIALILVLTFFVLGALTFGRIADRMAPKIKILFYALVLGGTFVAAFYFGTVFGQQHYKMYSERVVSGIISRLNEIKGIEHLLSNDVRSGLFQNADETGLDRLYEALERKKLTGIVISPVKGTTELQSTAKTSGKDE